MDDSPNNEFGARQGFRFIFINVFIVVYVLCTFLMCCAPSVFRDAAVKAIKPAANFFGLYQFFYMYSPDPPSIRRIFVCADITYADGSEKVFQFPLLDRYKDDFYRHQSKHRYYQWKYYLFFPSAYSEILPDAARWAARMNANPRNQPVKVTLFNATVKTLLPGVDDGKVSTMSMPAFDYFTYDVRPGDL